MKREMDWNDLRYFLAVARLGRLSPAARRLRVEHSTVARRIEGMERAMGTRLFDRHREGLADMAVAHQERLFGRLDQPVQVREGFRLRAP